MSNAIALKTNGAVVGVEEIKILKQSLFAGFSDPEINYCAAVSNELRLSPILKQVHFVKRGGKIVTQTGIDGLRLTAERTKKYAGSDDAVFEYEGNQKKIPSKATVTVYKMIEGQRVPITASARWDEYCPAPPSDSMWKKMPHGQLGKCAEALALRKAFPAELSSVYAEEEMQQADNQPNKAATVQARVVPNEPASIETTATVVDEPGSTEPDDEEPQVKVCSGCNTELVKSKTKPVLYCPKWDDKSVQHSKVYLD